MNNETRTVRDSSKKMALLEACLERTADSCGDIYPLVRERYYRRAPEAKAVFEEHAGGRREQMERQMLDYTLYSLMTFLERPSEIRMMLADAALQHDAMNISSSVVTEMLHVLLDVIVETIPDSEERALLLMEELRETLQEELTRGKH